MVCCLNDERENSLVPIKDKSTMTTKRQQAMLAAKSAPKVKKTAELSFEAFYDKNEATLEQLYELNLDALKACGDVTEKKRSFDDFVDWAYSLYTKFEIVDDDDEDDEDEVEDEEDEGDADDELTETESDEDEIEVTLGSDDPSSFDGESVDESDDDEDEVEDVEGETKEAEENKE